MKKLIKVLFVALVLSFSIFGLAGCDKKNPIVGKWQSKDYSSYVYTFNEDGTGDYSGTEFTYKTEGDKISIQYKSSTVPFESTYEIKDNVLNIKDSSGKDTLYTRK